MKRILVADDEPVIRALISAALQGLPGCEVVAVADGNECLAAARQLRPHLMLLDVRMPGRSGLEVCAALRSDPALSDVTVVMLSAMSQEADIERGREAGADDFVVKPFVPSELRSKVSALLDLAA